MRPGVLNRTGELVALSRKVVGADDVFCNVITRVLIVHLVLAELGDGRLLGRV